MRCWMTAIVLLTAAGAFCREDKEKVRFAVYDVVIDVGKNQLAAWQLELRYNPGRVRIVGIEGKGQAPYYDRRGLNAGRIIIAAFSKSTPAPPAGRVLVCRLHLRLAGDDAPVLGAKLVAAATAEGRKIPATIRISPSVEKKK